MLIPPERAGAATRSENSFDGCSDRTSASASSILEPVARTRTLSDSSAASPARASFADSVATEFELSRMTLTADSFLLAWLASMGSPNVVSGCATAPVVLVTKASATTYAVLPAIHATAWVTGLGVYWNASAPAVEPRVLNARVDVLVGVKLVVRLQKLLERKQPLFERRVMPVAFDERVIDLVELGEFGRLSIVVGHRDIIVVGSDV